MIDALILCGGLGTRVSDVSNGLPKSMLLVNGAPFLNKIIDSLILKGVNKIILCTGYMGEIIEDYYKTSLHKEKIIFSREKIRLGTGGAIINALKLVQSSKFLVLNGDSFCEFGLKKLLEFHDTNESDLTILIDKHKSNRRDVGLILIDNKSKITSFEEKTLRIDKSGVAYENCGVYLIEKKLFKVNRFKIGIDISFESNMIPIFIEKNKIYGLQIKNRLIDIGTSERYLNVKMKAEKES
jgi:NDP-sugar pyrophosphorylase family protein